MRVNGFTKLLAPFVLVGGVGAASAATVPFSDNFDSYGSTALEWTGSGVWDVTNGTVDLVADTAYGIRCRGNTGGCVDLDGGTLQAGNLATVSSSTFTLLAGQAYKLSAWISGSQRSYLPASNETVFGLEDAANNPLGTAADTGLLASNAPFTLFSMVFTPTATTVAKIFFQNTNGSGDNVGPILDDVSLTAVPLPAAVWLLLSGIAGVGVMARRRRAGGAVAA